MISFLLFLSSLPFLSASLSSSHIISLPLTRHTYDRLPNPHEIHAMAVGSALTTQGCAQNNFFTPVQIGFNQYKLTVDTLFATTAVADVTCNNCNGITPLYVPGPTATLQAGAVQQTYVDGRGWRGITYNDDITLPGTTLPKVNMGFAGITSQVGAFFPNKRCDGLNLTLNNNQGTLGLGPRTAVLAGTNAIFDALLQSTTPPIDAIMAIQMCAVGGRLWLGGYDNNYMIGLPSFAPMSTSTTTYGAAITDLLLGGVSANIPTTSFGTVVIDTTTTNMLFPQPIYTTVISALTSNPDFVAAFGATFFSDGLCITPKSQLSIDDLNIKLPHLLIKMGTQVQLDMQPISSYIREFITLQNTNVGIMGNKLYCPGISVSPNPTRTTLGWTFLNQFTTIIDRVNQRIGFARTSNCGGFVGADANFINVQPSTPGTATPFMKSPAFIGVIVAVVVVSLVVIGVGVFYGRRFFTGRQYNDKLKSLNYTTRSPNVKVQFADPVVGSKGFLNAGPTQPTTRNAAHSVEEDGVYTDSPLATSPLSSSASENGFSPMNEPMTNPQQPPRPPRAMVAQRGMMNTPIQQTTVQPSWSQQNSRQPTPNESPRDWSNQTLQPNSQPSSQRESPRQQNIQSWGNQAQQSSWGNQSQQQSSWGNQQQQSWGNQQQKSSWGNQARNQQQPPRNPGQLQQQPQAPPRKYNGGGGAQQQSEWVQHYDEQDGSPYYYNTRTQETTWERPASFGSRY